MSLDSLITAALEDEIKFVFVGGKGGVGKTTSSSAIACALATAGKRVLLISTDPAHSLGDAWRMKFSNTPKSPMDKLHVMEVNPKEIMEKELHSWMELTNNIMDSDENSGDSNVMEKVASFQEWLSGIPGIDEATALSSSITHIESGEYDIIVFDTAPTGHTLKLLGLPDILEKGIEKIESLQSTLWGYWETFKGLGSEKSRKKVSAKDSIAEKLHNHKCSIQKVAMMLQDQIRTRFVVVCIAEFLSVSETQRLLYELDKNGVKASHVVVNQLVNNALESKELAELEGLAEVGNLQLSQELLQKTVHACRLTTARKNLQQKYLKVLKDFPETQGILDGICEVPLLAEEVTGIDAIRRFSKLLCSEDDSICHKRNVATPSSPGALYDDQIAEKNNDKVNTELNSHSVGDIVQVIGLVKASHFNNLKGKIVSKENIETGRYGVSIIYEGKKKTLALQPKNMVHVEKKTSDNEASTKKKMKVSPAGGVAINSEMMDKAKTLLENPEIKRMIDEIPRARAALMDCLENPMNAMKYMQDPELSPIFTKAMSML